MDRDQERLVTKDRFREVKASSPEVWEAKVNLPEVWVARTSSPVVQEGKLPFQAAQETSFSEVKVSSSPEAKDNPQGSVREVQARVPEVKGNFLGGGREVKDSSQEEGRVTNSAQTAALASGTSRTGARALLAPALATPSHQAQD